MQRDKDRVTVASCYHQPPQHTKSLLVLGVNWIINLSQIVAVWGRGGALHHCHFVSSSLVLISTLPVKAAKFGELQCRIYLCESLPLEKERRGKKDALKAERWTGTNGRQQQLSRWFMYLHKKVHWGSGAHLIAATFDPQPSFYKLSCQEPGET